MLAYPPRRVRPRREQGRGQGRRGRARTAEDVGRPRRPGPVLPRPRLGRRRQARLRDRPGLGGRPRGRRRRDVPRPRRQPRAAPRPVFVPVRRRPDGPAGRVAPVRRGAPGTGRPDEVGPARRRAVRCRRRAIGVPIGQGRAPDRPGRARLDLERGEARRRRPPARLGAGLQPRPQGVGDPDDPQPPRLPPARRGLARRGGRLDRRTATRRSTWPSISPAPT